MKKSIQIDQHISQFPKETQKQLELLRMTIQKAAPGAEEVISYGMPAYRLNGILVWFAGYKAHIGFYPSASPIVIFSDELKKFKTSKGAIQFEIDKPLPLPLITKIVKLRIKQNEEKLAEKNKKTCAKGHTFIKSSDCPTCPICEKARKPTAGLLSTLSAPARRALESKKIKTARQLAKFTKKEILSLHGMGPRSLPALQKALAAEGLSFKKEK